jgi:hypothetical protein
MNINMIRSQKFILSAIFWVLIAMYDTSIEDFAYILAIVNYVLFVLTNWTEWRVT